MPVCAVYGCNTSHRNQHERGLKLFTFPKDPTLQKQWINACKRKDNINVKSALICSLHFSSDAYQKPLIQQVLGYSPQKCRKIKPDAIPTQSLPNNAENLDKTEARLRTERALKRESHALACSLLEKNVNENRPPSSEVTSAEENTGEEIQQTLPSDTADKDLTSKINRFSEELKKSKSIISGLEKRVMELEKDNEHYKILVEKQSKDILYYKNIIENKPSKNTEDECEKRIYEILGRTFTKGQIALLISGKKQLKEWPAEDIAAAISLRSVSPKAYRYLRKRLNYPLPALSTLRRHAAKFSASVGVQEDVLLLMKNKGVSLSESDKVTALAFDEMYLSPLICFDRSEECVCGPHKRVQVVVARGLFSKWKQPVFYDFDFDMAKEQLLLLITRLHESGYNVVSITSDMGPSNMALWRQMEVSHTSSCFLHPVTREKIFVFIDPPHLLKNARNHFIDSGFTLQNGTYIGRSLVDSVLDIETSELKIAYKISKNHLEVKDPQRQNVKSACELLSQTTAQAIRFCGTHGLIKNRNWEEGAQVIELINLWFDIVNSTSKYGKCESGHAFGVSIDEQLKILNEVDNLISTMRIHSKRCLLPFQSGILMTNMSLKNLFQHLVGKYGIKYILTRRLNQDVVENMFSYIRGMGGSNDHPTALSWKHRFRWYVLGKHSNAFFVENKNCEDDSDIVMTSEIFTKSRITDENKPQEKGNEQQEGYIEEEIITLEGPSGVSFSGTPSESDAHILEQFELEIAAEDYTGNVLEEQALGYIAGYVAKEFSQKCPMLKSNESAQPINKIECIQYDWISFISKGHLTHPSEEFLNVAKISEIEFQKYHGSNISKKKGIIKDLTMLIQNKIPQNFILEEALHCLVRTRTFIRIRSLNQRIYSEMQEKRRKRQIKKFKSPTSNLFST